MDQENLQLKEPLTFVIFGATGDLAYKKLYPSLFQLYRKGVLSEEFRIVGFARSDQDDEGLREYALGSVRENLEADEQELNSFLQHIFYVQGSFDNSEDYKKLAGRLRELDEEIGLCPNRLFYLAAPPKFYHTIFKQLAGSELNQPCSEEKWTRVLVEKPFGSDLRTARELDRELGGLFDEEQIFRIDHYLQKETLENLLMFRFSNLLFEPVWHGEYVEKVCIRMYEEFGVEDRGSFYDSIGALRDVGQNHILQMLAHTAMDDPGELSARAIRNKRANVLEELSEFPIVDFATNAYRAQYEGYRQIDGVADDSDTETYFWLRTFVDNERWQGVPFELEGGKCLSETRTEIEVTFQHSPRCLCTPETEGPHKNVVTFQIKPDKQISVRFWSKKPGFTSELEARDLSFNFSENELSEQFADAYERILFDAMRGDQTRFARTDEVEASWRFITPILENWDKAELEHYQPGEFPG